MQIVFAVLNTGKKWRMDTVSREVTLSIVFCIPSEKGYILKGKQHSLSF